MIDFSELLDNRYADCRLEAILVKMAILAGSNDSNPDPNPETQKFTAFC